MRPQFLSEYLRVQRVDRFLFSIGLAVWLFCGILLTSRYGYGGGIFANLLQVGVYSGVLLCVFSELFTNKLDPRSILLFFTLIAVVFALRRVGGNDVAYALIIIFSSRRFSFKYLLKVTTLITTISVVCVLASFAIGVIGQVYENGRGRGSLGFGWVTFLSHYYLMIVAGYVVLRGSRIKSVELLIIMLIDVVIFILTGARNSFFLILVYGTVTYLIKITNHWKPGKLIRSVSSAAFPACAMFSWLLYILVNPYTNFGSKLDLLLSGRIALTHQAINLYGVNLLGSPVEWVTGSSISSGAYDASQYLYVDCSYINILINYGLLFTIAILAVLGVVSMKATQRGGSIMALTLVVFAVHGIIDPQLLDLKYCAFLLLLSGVFDTAASWDQRMEGLIKNGAINASKCRI